MTLTERNNLVKQNTGLAYYWSRRFPAVEDGLQIASLALIEAAEKHNPERGNFGVLAAYYCRRDLGYASLDRIIRQPYNKKKRICYQVTSLNEPIKEDGALLEELIPDENSKNDAEDNLFWHEISKFLTKTEYQICLKFANGFSLQDIALELNINFNQVRHLKRQAFEKVRASMRVRV